MTNIEKVEQALKNEEYTLVTIHEKHEYGTDYIELQYQRTYNTEVKYCRMYFFEGGLTTVEGEFDLVLAEQIRGL